MVEGVNVTHPVQGMAGPGSKASEAATRAASDGACAQAGVAGSRACPSWAGAGDLAAPADARTTPGERVQAAAERLVEALHALGAEELADGQETLAGVIAGTQVAIAACVDAQQLRTAEAWTALGEMATAIRDHVVVGPGPGTTS